MEVLAPSSEDEMVALFIRAELDSERLGPRLRATLERAGADERVLFASDQAELRRHLLEETRSYASRRGLFHGFPDDLRWELVALGDTEVESLQTIVYSYWLEITGGTRLFTDAARRIREGVTPFGVANDGFFELADAIAAGDRPLEPILVTAGGDSPLVVLEGHARLTGYALVPAARPRPFPALLGTSPRMRDWACY